MVFKVNLKVELKVSSLAFRVKVYKHGLSMTQPQARLARRWVAHRWVAPHWAVRRWVVRRWAAGSERPCSPAALLSGLQCSCSEVEGFCMELSVVYDCRSGVVAVQYSGSDSGR